MVENRTGFAGNLAADAAAKEEPDGYTLLLGTIANAISASVYKKKLRHNFLNDFTGIARVASAPNVLVVDPALGVSSVQGLIDYAKARPGKLFFGSAGVGTAPHLSGELFKQMTGIEYVHVPYKGNVQGLGDLSEGRLSMIFAPAPTLGAFVKTGRVKALAVTTAKRASFLPDVPTMVESGLPGFDTAIWYGFLAPKGTPQAIISSLAKVILEATDREDVQKQLANSLAVPVPLGPTEFNRFIREDVEKWAKVVGSAKITVD
jgi:tripartite-type tricarboxylate transporter receptor subunit TctC